MSQRTNKALPLRPTALLLAFALLGEASTAVAQREHPPATEERVEVDCVDSGATPETVDAGLRFDLPPLGTEGTAELRRAGAGSRSPLRLACERNVLSPSDRTTLFDIAVCQGTQTGRKYVVTLQWGGFTQEFGAHLQAQEGFSSFFFCRTRSAIIPSL